MRGRYRSNLAWPQYFCWGLKNGLGTRGPIGQRRIRPTRVSRAVGQQRGLRNIASRSSRWAVMNVARRAAELTIDHIPGDRRRGGQASVWPVSKETRTWLQWTSRPRWLQRASNIRQSVPARRAKIRHQKTQSIVTQQWFATKPRRFTRRKALKHRHDDTRLRLVARVIESS